MAGTQQELGTINREINVHRHHTGVSYTAGMVTVEKDFLNPVLARRETRTLLGGMQDGMVTLENSLKAAYRVP